MDSNIILDLIEHTKDRHLLFRKIYFANDYIKTFITRKAFKLIIKELTRAANKLFNTYCKAIKQHQADVNTLLAYKHLCHAIAFYEEELRIVNLILADYEDYLYKGNFISAFILGEERYD